MGAFRNPNFIAEFAYRTKWNYYTMRSLQENNWEKQRDYEKKLADLEKEMIDEGFYIDDFYDVTQLINSMIGLLIFPEQAGYDSLSNKSIDLEKQFPLLYECISEEGAFYSNYRYLKGDNDGDLENKSPQIILKHLRNAASHQEIGILPENGRLQNGKKSIIAVVFRDQRMSKYGEMKFQLRIPVEKLEDLLIEISDCIIKLT